MKRIIIYRGLLVVALLMMASLTRAEVLGIKDLSECPTKGGSILEVKDKAVLISALNNLSPQSVDASPYFQADKNRFVFCMSTDPKWYKYTSITLQPVTLTNSSIYPVVIYGLNVESTLSAPATTLLTTNGNGELALQNLTTIKQDGSSVGLKAPILLQGKTTVLESTVSCDATNTAAAFVVSSDKNTFRKVAINDCAHGLDVAGNYNNFYEVAIQNLATAADQVGAWGVTVSGKLNAFVQLITSGYEQGVKIDASYNRITSSTLGGSVAAVQIARGVLGIKLSQNTFTTVNTIAYADLEDAKARTLLSVEWMGFHKSEADPEYADRIIGKLGDPTNTTDMVELVLQTNVENHFSFEQFCKVGLASEPMKFKMQDGTEKELIASNEKYFDCAFGPDGKTALHISLKKSARFLSNTPSASMMSANIAIEKLSEISTTVLILPGQVVSGEGGGLTDVGGG